MAGHWTYAKKPNVSADLEQGDVLSPTAELRAVFSSVHPHFVDEKYAGFMIASQSCDLVRRASQPKAPYVTLVTMRPLVQVLPLILSEAAAPVVPGIFKASQMPRARDLLSRICNQNEQALGLFYLHTDLASGISEPTLAFLRVSVSLRREHYDILLRARAGRLIPDFQAKLGWLLGNLFARPATPDWSDFENGKSQLAMLLDSCLTEQSPGLGPRWIEDQVVEEARRRKIDLATASEETLAACKPVPPIERAIELINEHIDRVAAGAIDADKRAALASRLRNDPKLSKLFQSRGR